MPYVSLSESVRLPQHAGIYFVFNESGTVVYIGRSLNLKKRWQAHHIRIKLCGQDDLNAAKRFRIAWMVAESAELKRIETELIRHFKPAHNRIRIAKKPRTVKTEGKASTENTGHVTAMKYEPKEDLTGRQFNNLTVESCAGKPPRGQHGAIWLCRCVCGNQAIVRTGDLKKGQQSCGCLGSRTTRGNRSRTHGMFGCAEYWIWAAMKRRCQTPSDSNYHKYGARGITVCERWQTFENFYADMGPRPSPGHSVDRKNNDSGYSPDNCVWATKSQQSRNRRTARMLTLNGETQNMVEWEKRTGIDASTILARLKLGWSDHDALTRPLRHSANWKSRRNHA